MSDTRSEIDTLMEFLAGRGFDLLEEQSEPLFFNDRWLRWRRHDIKIQVALDRGRWFVDVPPADWPDWHGYGLEIVLDALDDATRFTHLLPLEAAVTVLQERLDEIAEFLGTREGRQAVTIKRQERAKGWFGL